MKKLILIFGLVILFAPSLAHAATYYVSPTGTAAWSACTDINTPCGGRTAAENAVAGDIVLYRGGTYDPVADPVDEWTNTAGALRYEKLPWNPQNSGTSGNPITFKAYPGETPIILDSVYSGSFGVTGDAITAKSWIVYDGFTSTIVDNDTSIIGNLVISLVMILYGDNITIKNCNLIGINFDSYNNAALIRLDYSNNIIIENNRIHGMNGYGSADSEWLGVEATNSAGILNFYSRNMTIRNNDIYDNYLGIWDKDTEQNNVFYNNHIWGGSTDKTRCRVGIQTNDQRDEYGVTSGQEVYQNVIRNCTTGIFVYDGVGTQRSPKYYNNVIYAGTGSVATEGIFVTDRSLDAEFYDNIIYGYPIPLRYYTPGTTVNYSDNNTFYNTSSMVWNLNYATNYGTLSAWTTATTLDGSSITTDPSFVNADGIYPDDYMLDSGSPAKGSGRTATDLGAFPAGTRIDIGASRPRAPQTLN